MKSVYQSSVLLEFNENEFVTCGFSRQLRNLSMNYDEPYV